MTKGSVTVLGALAFILTACGPAQPFPLGASLIGGLGFGYYSMSDLNQHIGAKRQSLDITLDELTSGVNFRIEGRLWALDLAALTGGYEYYWGETSSTGTSETLTYRTPADVYTVGVIAPLIKVKSAFDICLGLNICMTKAVLEMKEENTSSRIIPSYKGDDSGYEAYAEVNTRFLDPFEVGFQLGYRGVKITTLTSSRTGQVAYFSNGPKIQIDYSGVFFFLTAGFRI